MNTETQAPRIDEPVDLLIVGGGVNGAGIARDAIGRGLSVLLCEKDDLAQGTSSRSGKLVHGGLRYLEYYEFRLVREALREREVLLGMAPHIIWPMRFVLPHSKALRPAWMIRLGLFLYDHLGGRERLPGTRTLNLRVAPEGAPLREEYTRAFEYSDCWVDDARLVILNAKSAAERGAEVLTRTACTRAWAEGPLWRAELTDSRTGRVTTLSARAIVNAAGPWVENVLAGVTGSDTTQRVRLVKGSHIVVPKFWTGDNAYLIQNTDKRVIFINPYEGEYALIGTTDIPYSGNADNVEIDSQEIAYLCDVVNRYFKRAIGASDVVYAFSGVRPLYEDEADNPSAVTRDYVFDVSGGEGKPVLLTIYGGKITTYRKLAEHALERLRTFFPAMRAPWTAGAALPGGDVPGGDFDAVVSSFRRRFPWFPAEATVPFLRRHGTCGETVLAGASSVADMGVDFGAFLYEREVRYLINEEWAVDADDILWRRTKCGLHMTPDQRREFSRWMDGNGSRVTELAGSDVASTTPSGGTVS